MRNVFSPLMAAALTVGVAAVLSSQPAQASFKNTGTQAQEQRKQAAAQIPVCQRPIGTISVIEPEDATNWWTGQQLPAPSRLIKVFVSRSRCFTLVDRLIGGKAGAIVGGLNFRSKTADVVLTVTDVRSSEQVAISEGSARKSDIGFGAGGGLFGGGGFGAAGVGGYANTEIGQVITMAYLQAYTDIVAQLGGLPENASAANAQQAVTVTRPGRLLANAKGTGAPVRSLDPGMMLYPTGNKEGVMWEVEDELGNKGWVSSTLLELSK